MLIKDGALAEDDYTKLSNDTPLPSGAILVPLRRFKRERDELVARGKPLGVVLETEDSPDEIGEHVQQLSLIVLQVPHFKDGRAFSWARVLRQRFGFTGEIRVSGHVLFDQIAFYRRVGVNAFELSPDLTPDDFNAALAEITNVYQPAGDDRETISDLRSGQ